MALLIGLGFSAFDSRADAEKRVCVFDLESREIQGWYIKGTEAPNNLAIWMTADTWQQLCIIQILL